MELNHTDLELIPPPEEGYVIHWDDQLKGFGLRVTNSGVKSFIVQGRVLGKSVIVTIGRLGLYDEPRARELAQANLQAMREGIDPREARKPKTVSYGTPPSDKERDKLAGPTKKELELERRLAQVEKERDALQLTNQYLILEREQMLDYIKQGH